MRSKAMGVIGIPSRKEWAYVRENMYSAIDAAMKMTSIAKTITARL